MKLHCAQELRWLIGLAAAVTVACSGSETTGEGPSRSAGLGGSAGGTAGPGGSSGIGGTTTVGGQTSSGNGTGRTSSGGRSTGGASTAGTSSGGQSTGGLAAGGTSSGGQPAGGASTSGGASPAGGASTSGGASPAGGADGGSTTSSGGRIGSGGATGTGGNGGSGSAGGTTGSGGATGTGGNGGSSSAGGTAGSGGNKGNAGPCDIYESAQTPCVAAHSTVRALYGSYGGKLYEVRRASDGSTQDIAALAPGGVADAAAQDSFCAGTKCTISIIYDQSPNGNHLTKSPPGGWLNNGGLEADATAAKVKLGGQTVYGVYTTMNWDNDVGAVGYRNNQTQGVPTGDDPEAMYMVVSGKHYNEWCCFDYGNAETNNLDNGKATMEAVYFGSSTQWAKGNGNGPWVLADLEDGVYHGGDANAVTATNTPIVADYVTAMLKGPSGNRFVLKGGDAQSGKLSTKYDGARPAGYSPQKKEGAIILGTGGDNSHTGEGTFFEGCITTGVPSDAVDDAIQANIVAAGYGR
jgi:hypothetical protein